MNRVFAWPVGGEGGDEDERERRSPLSIVLIFAASSTVGGLLLGAAIGLIAVLLSGVPRSWMVGPASLVVFLAIVLEITGQMGFFPERRGQVPTSWLHRGGITAAGFGFLLGGGVFTWIHHAAAYAIAVALIYLGRLDVAIAAGLVFGATRGLVPVLFRLTVHRELQAIRVQSLIARGSVLLAGRLLIGAASGLLLWQLLSQAPA
jgi:hypothetical protein